MRKRIELIHTKYSGFDSDDERRLSLMIQKIENESKMGLISLTACEIGGCNNLNLNCVFGEMEAPIKEKVIKFVHRPTGVSLEAGLAAQLEQMEKTGNMRTVMVSITEIPFKTDISSGQYCIIAVFEKD